MVGQSLNNARVLNGTLPAFMVFLAVLLTFSFVVLTLSTLAGLQLGNLLLRPSPFVAFEAIWPGQSVTSLAAYARHSTEGSLACVSGASPRQTYVGLDVRVASGAYDTLGQTIKCVDYPHDGVFRAVSVTIVDERIQELEFFSADLAQDVLLLYWGIPDSITRAGSQQELNLYWKRSAYVAMASVLDADSLARSVTITAVD